MYFRVPSSLLPFDLPSFLPQTFGVPESIRSYPFQLWLSVFQYRSFCLDILWSDPTSYSFCVHSTSWRIWRLLRTPQVFME